MPLPPAQHLTSPQNPHVKELVDLRKDGEVRRARQCFFLEGRRAVAAALATPQVSVHELIFCEKMLGDDLALIAQAHARQVALTRVSLDVFRKIADVVSPQGVAAVVQMPQWPLAGILTAPRALVLVACGIQDPGNFGTLIRSCEAAGAAGVVALEGTADPFNAKVVRSTAATLLSLPIVRARKDEFLLAVQKHALRLVATCARGGSAYRAFDWRTRPLALCIGSEGAGLPADLEAACTAKVTIPMRGSAESLNAAVAASILLFEAQAGE